MPFISLAGAVEIIDPVRKYVFKTPHTDKMACEKIFEDLKQRKLTDNRADFPATDGFGSSMKAQCVIGPHRTTASGSSPRKATVRRDSDMTGQLTKIKNTPACRRSSIRASGRGLRS